MESAEIVSAMVDFAMESAELQVRAVLAGRGISATDADIERVLAPLKYHIAAAYTDDVEAIHGL